MRSIIRSRSGKRSQPLAWGERPAPRGGGFCTAVEWSDAVKRAWSFVTGLYRLERDGGGAFELACAGERAGAAVRDIWDGAVEGRVPWQGHAPVREGGEFAARVANSPPSRTG